MALEKSTAEEETAYVYLLLYGDGTYYCGYTVDMGRQLAAHRAERGAKYTHGRGPLTPIYLKHLPNKWATLCREAALRRLPRSRKGTLLRNPGNLAGGENGSHL